MGALKAGFFKQQLVVTGGQDDEDNKRDEVLWWNSLTDDAMSCFSLQVLLFSPSTNAWTQIGKLQIGRSFHAIAEVNLHAVCFGIGNLNPIQNKSQSKTGKLKSHHHQGGTFANLFKSAIGNSKYN